MKKVFVVLGILFLFPGRSSADFSSNALIGYLTGIPTLSDSLFGNTADYKHPALLSRDISPYIEFGGSSQEVLRSLKGQGKRVNHGLLSTGLNYPLVADKAGMYISYSDNRSSITWPFSKKRIRVIDAYNSGSLCVSGYLLAQDRFRAGVTLGKRFSGGNSSSLKVFEFSGRLPRWSGSLRYFNIPYEWGIDLNYENITKPISSQLRHSGLEGELSYSLTKSIKITISGEKGDIDTSEQFRGVPNKHAQVWNFGNDRWRAKMQNARFFGTILDVSYGEDTLSGELDLWYNGDQYMLGDLDGVTRRFECGVQFDIVPRYIPYIRYDRVSTDLAISRGIIDSLPFTPKQIEIIGDKTWTFSGTGRIISNSGTFLWKPAPQSRLAVSFVRMHPDYRLRIITRSHLVIDPWEMLFGKRRIETDRTRYYDFALLSYRKSVTFGLFSIEFSLSQLIPIQHSKKPKPGLKPAPPSRPKLRFEKPNYLGGFSFEVKGKLFI